MKTKFNSFEAWKEKRGYGQTHCLLEEILEDWEADRKELMLEKLLEDLEDDRNTNGYTQNGE